MHTYMQSVIFFILSAVPLSKFDPSGGAVVLACAVGAGAAAAAATQPIDVIRTRIQVFIKG